MLLSQSVLDRFWPNVNKNAPPPVRVPSLGNCWLWSAGRFNNGYGFLSLRGQPTGTHRISWEIHNGPIPEGLCVLHHCDVRACVRPDHLFVGSKKDNAVDAATKRSDPIKRALGRLQGIGAYLDDADSRSVYIDGFMTRDDLETLVILMDAGILENSLASLRV